MGKRSILLFIFIKSAANNNEVDVDDNGDPSLDRDFFYSLRDLKSLLDKEKEHRYTVCQTLGKNNMRQRSNIEGLL